MKYLERFNSFPNNTELIIVDVQESFKQFFSVMFLHELKNYCKEFKNVYQIWDNHHQGKKVDKDYLYDDKPSIPISGDLYFFPNQKELIEKRYNYDVDADFYDKKMQNKEGKKGILDGETFREIKSKEERGLLSKGDIYKTTEGTIIVYIGNNHKWFHVPVKLYELLIKLKGKEVIIVGGSDSECLEDIVTTAEKLGVNIKRNWKYIYSASHCPIK